MVLGGCHAPNSHIDACACRRRSRLFVLSESGQANGFWTSGPSWLGTIGWFGFLICVLLLVVSGLYALFLRIRKPRSPRT